MPGSDILEAEVTNISRHGFWLYFDDSEVFVPFKEFPWFQGASVDAILTVESPSARHLYWPKLDIDLTVEMIEHPEHFPLKARVENTGPA